MNRIKIYIVCLRTAFSQAAAYRTDFILGSFITLLSNILFPLVTILIYANGASFPGWSMWEVLLIQSVFSMSSGAAAMVFGSVLWVTMDHIQSGSFETVLLKPVSPLFFIVSTNFDIQNIGLFLGGLILTIISAAASGAGGASHIFCFLLLFLSGLIVMSGLNLIMAAVSFKWIGNSRIPEIFDSLKEFGKYPLGIFPKAVRVLSAFVIPAAVIGFFPASALLGRLNPSAFCAILPCIVLFAFGIWIYHHMIQKYEGVGG